MPRTKGRPVYSLDPETVRALERIANRWKVSKSAALRRAIFTAADDVPRPAANAIRALDQLQQSLRLTPGRAEVWARTARRERRSASDRRDRKGR